jgi:TolB protein
LKRALPLAAVVALAGALAAGVHGGGSAFPGANGKLAFSRVDTRSTRIWVMSPGGGGQRAVTAGQSSGLRYTASEPAWSPDGTKIVFSDGYSIRVMSADGSAGQVLTATGSREMSPEWSPSGQQIVFVSERAGGDDLWIMNADGTDPHQLTANANKFQIDGDPSWSPDGTTIAFVRVSQRIGSDFHAHVYLVDAMGGTPRRLTSGRASDVDPDWSPDGKKIVFLRASGVAVDIYVVNADRGGLRRLTRSALKEQSPAWSPDGKRIVFSRGVNTQAHQSSHIYVMNADGTGQRRLTNTKDLDFAPDWQPLPKP